MTTPTTTLDDTVLDTPYEQVLSCMSTYVRSAILNRETREELLEKLERRVPYVQTGFGVIAMIDISGYSALTSSLTSLGKLSSEIITSTIQMYMSQGDVIKFLGDAILVCFSQRPGESESELVARATICCLHITIHLRTCKVDLANAVKNHTGHRGGDKTFQSMITSPTSTNSDPSYASGNLGSESQVVSLEIHVAVVSGSVEHVVMGLPHQRMDYTIHGDCMSELGPILDGTKRGELGLSTALTSFFPKSTRKVIERMLDAPQDNFFILKNNECQQAIYDVLKSSSANVKRLLARAKKSALPHFQTSADVVSPVSSSTTSRRASVETDNDENNDSDQDQVSQQQQQQQQQDLYEVDEDTYELLRLFVNESLVHKLESEHFKNTPGLGSAPATTWKRRRSSVPSFSSNVSRTTTKTYTTLIKVGGGGTSSSTDSGVDDYSTKPSPTAAIAPKFRSEFRNVSVVFVKILSEFTALEAQHMFQSFIAIVKKWEGVFQQFSVDDKGQTMLACFGLPPWTHEKDALYALKAAMEFEKFVETRGKGKISISIATGELLFSRLGNEMRCDASLLGDTVNVAARLMGIGYSSSGGTSAVIKCDAATFSATKEDFVHISLGLHKLKGKDSAVEVWTVQSKDDVTRSKTVGRGGSAMNSPAREERTTFGYTAEKKVLAEAFQEWLSEPGVRRQVIVEGKSGYGKSKMIDEVTQSITNAGIDYCLTQASEIKQYSPFYSIQHIIHYILTRHGDLSPQLEADEMTKSTANFDNKSTKSTLPDITKYDLGSKGRRGSSMSISARSGYRRPSLMMSASKSQLSQYSKHDGANESAYGNTALKFLAEMGEDSSLAPLLNDVLPFRAVPDSPFTKLMDAGTKRTLLKSMVIRILNASIQKEKFVIIIDDAQWMDSMSVDVLDSIVYKCPNIMLYVFMRPVADNLLKTFTHIGEAPDMKKVVLNGLTKEEIEEVLLYKFADFNPKDVAARVISVMHEKTGGSPLVIDSICETIKAQFSDIFLVLGVGTLCFHSVRGEAKLDLLASVDAAVLMQFDRLSPRFQAVLRKATVLGQYFDLEDLCVFCIDHPTVIDLEELISKEDTFDYLIKQPTEGEFAYYFRNNQIMTSIYSSQSFAERSQTHLEAAQYFEAMLTDANREFMLPIVVHHYRKTQTDPSNDKKKIQYLEELGMMHYEKAHFQEAAATLEALVEVNGMEVAPDNDIIRLCTWLSHLAHAKVISVIVTTKEVSMCFRVLELLGHPLPNAQDAKKQFSKDAWNLFVLWTRTKGGTRPLPSEAGCGITLSKKSQVFPEAEYLTEHSDKMKPVDKLRWSAYGTLYTIASWTNLVPKEVMGLVLFRLLGTIMIYGHANKVLWSGILNSAAFGFMWGLPGVANIFFRQSLKIESMIHSEEDQKATHKMYEFKSLILMYDAKLKQAHDCFMKYMANRPYLEISLTHRYQSKRGETHRTLLAINHMQLIFNFQGDHISLEKEIAENLNSYGTFQVLVVRFHAGRRINQGRLQDAHELLRHLKDIMPNYVNGKESVEFLDISNLPIELMLSIVQKGSYQRALEVVEQITKLNLMVQMPPYCTTTDLILQVPIYVLMLTFPLDDKSPKGFRPWAADEERRLSTSLEMMHKRLRTLEVYNLYKWPILLLKVYSLWFGQKKQKALHLLLNSLKQKKNAVLLEELTIVKAIIHGFLGIHLDKKEERAGYFAKAVKVFEETGFVVMENWIKKSDKVIYSGC
ncbi:hypothetical protein HDV05_003733 [Chytridiales sp. JEL 0842]|nr:hypothetical protein HDV05_003733 [Chytridiales sp. JEL 0842]